MPATKTNRSSQPQRWSRMRTHNRKLIARIAIDYKSQLVAATCHRSAIKQRTKNVIVTLIIVSGRLMLGRLALSGCCLGFANMSLAIAIIVTLRTQCGVCVQVQWCVVRLNKRGSRSYMFRADEVDGGVSRTSRTVIRTGPGSLLKTRLRRGGTRRPYKCTQTQGQPLPGGLKPGAQYQCLTTCLFLGSIGLVHCLQGYPSHFRTPVGGQM
jgi:hypothetical protein